MTTMGETQHLLEVEDLDVRFFTRRGVAHAVRNDYS